jgi:hypothetical protein
MVLNSQRGAQKIPGQAGSETAKTGPDDGVKGRVSKQNYAWRPERNGYQVVEPPANIKTEQLPLIADELFIYPKNGQSEKQIAADRYQCHVWSREQTQYDPTQPPTNLGMAELSRKREDYQRAMRACLEGRSYSVR